MFATAADVPASSADSRSKSLSPPTPALGFQNQNFGPGVKGSLFLLTGFGFRASGFDFGLRVSGGFGFRVSGFGFRVSGLGFQVSGLWFRISGFGWEGLQPAEPPPTEIAPTYVPHGAVSTLLSGEGLGLGFGVSFFMVKVLGFGFGVWGSGSGFGVLVLGFGV